MKIKINPFYIICIIILELIMINFLIIFLFIRNNHADSAETKPVKPIAVQKKPVAKDTEKKNVGLKKPVKTVNQTAKAPKKENSPQKVNSPKNLAGKYQYDTLGVHDRIIDEILRIDQDDYAGILLAKHHYLLVEKNDFIATAYDLSYQSCGKYPGDPAYGITFSGTKAVRGRTIAVDPGVIPLGSKVYVEFPDEYTKLDGWYVAEDTGNKIKGKIIDVFMGKSALKEAMQFGRRNVKLKIQLQVH